MRACCSWKDGILLALDIDLLGINVDRTWLDEFVYSVHFDRKVGKLSNPRQSWAGL